MAARMDTLLIINIQKYLRNQSKRTLDRTAMISRPIVLNETCTLLG